MKRMSMVMAAAVVLLMLGATAPASAYHITGTWKDPVANVAKGNVGVMADQWPGTGADSCDPAGTPNPGLPDHDENTAIGTGLICNDMWWAGNSINIQLATLEDLLDPALAAASTDCNAVFGPAVCATPIAGNDGLTLRDIDPTQCADNGGSVPNDVCDEVIVPAQIVQGVVVCEREAGLLGPTFAGTLNGVGVLPAAAGWGGMCFSAEENTDLTKKKPLDYDQWVQMDVQVDPAAAGDCGGMGDFNIGYFARLGSNAHGLEVQDKNNFFYRQMVAALVDDGHVTYFINGDEIGGTPTNCYGYDVHEKCPAPGELCSEPTKSEILDTSGDLDVDASLGCNRLVGHEPFVPESYDYGANARMYDNPDTDADQDNDVASIIDQNTVCTGPPKTHASFSETGVASGTVVASGIVEERQQGGNWDLENTGTVGLKIVFKDAGGTVVGMTTVAAGNTGTGSIPSNAATFTVETTAAGDASGTVVLRGP